MKKGLKLALGIGLLSIGAVTFSSCTASFCSSGDTAHILFRYDYGITEYWNATDPDKPTEAELVWEDNPNIYYTTSLEVSPGLKSIITSARNANIEVPYLLDYWETFDQVLLDTIIQNQGLDHKNITNASTISSADHDNPGLLLSYGYTKFFNNIGPEDARDKNLWDSWKNLNEKTVQIMGDAGLIGLCPSSDFTNYYKAQMNSFISQYKACLVTTQDGYYGNYGYGDADKGTVYITKKDWSYAWSKGFFEGLFVYPIGCLIDVFCNSFSSLGAGGAAILSIVLVTLIVRGIMLLFTFKQSADTAKMNELQPQIQKIQAKYPNSNTNQYEKQRMGEEMQKLYKKEGIHPFRSIIVMVVQFPIFICVWGAMTGSAALSTGSFLGLNLNSSIKDVLFNSANWGGTNWGAVTALFLFILMSLAQAVAMLLPQWIQKKKAKEAAKLGKNPAAKSQNNKMKWFTYIMLVMIIIMGFSLVSAMGVYWLIGAVISVAQTLITQAIQNKKKKGAK